MFQGVAEHHGIRLAFTHDGPLAISGNRHHLRQVLNNLLDNAIKFTAARYGGDSSRNGSQDEGQGRIDVALARDDERRTAVLRITDNGIGIPAESLPHLFDRFYRGDKSRAREGSVAGTGLGLSVCKAIVTAHHGTIEVTSQPGRGTTFIIHLPLARSAQSAQRVEQPASV
jgi:signal transduction histidine kinase